MKLDGEKLLADLKAEISELRDSDDELATGAILKLVDISISIRSGRYTIKDKG